MVRPHHSIDKPRIRVVAGESLLIAYILRHVPTHIQRIQARSVKAEADAAQ